VNAYFVDLHKETLGTGPSLRGILTWIFLAVWIVLIRHAITIIIEVIIAGLL
jgi:hypothetical protein